MAICGAHYLTPERARALRLLISILEQGGQAIRVESLPLLTGAGAKRGLRLSLHGNCVCLRNSPRPSGRRFIHFFLVGEQFLDPWALLHALEMRRDVEEA
jgi:hypothetical protein